MSDTVYLNGSTVHNLSYVFKPTGYDSSQSTYPWIILCHGASGTSESWNVGQIGYSITSHFVNLGYVVVSAGEGIENGFGCQANVDAVNAIYNYVKANYRVQSKAILIGQSMGGIVALNTMIRNVDRFRALALIFPVSKLYAMWLPEAGSASYRATINPDYGMAIGESNVSTYLANTNGYDPHTRYADFALADIPIFIAHGDADYIVSKTQSTLFQSNVNALARKTLVTFQNMPGVGHDPTSAYGQFLSGADTFISTLPLNYIMSVSTPSIVRVGNIVTVLSTATNTAQPVSYYWGTDGVNFPYPIPGGVYDFVGNSGSIYIRAQVTDGQTYYSGIATFNLPVNVIYVQGPEDPDNPIPLPLHSDVQGYYIGGTGQAIKVVEPSDPSASVIFTYWIDETIKAIGGL